MTTIKEFRIEKLAGRQSALHYKLDPQVNIFWGLNGTGKTTLLRILDAALSNKTAELADLPFESAEVRFYSVKHDTVIVRRFDRSNMSIRDKPVPEDWRMPGDLDLDEDIAFHLSRDSADPGWETEAEHGELKSVVNSFKHSYLSISRTLDGIGSDGQLSELSADERFIRRVNTVWRRYSSQSLAAIRDIQQLGLAEVLAILFGGTVQPDTKSESGDVEDPRQETSADEAYDIVSDFLTPQRILLPLGKNDFTARYDKSSTHRHVVTRIRSVMKQIEHVLAPQIEVQAVINESYVGNKHLLLKRQGSLRGRVEVEIDEESIPLTALSSGEKQLLHILLETLAVTESTIMIDEPEISLHPDWQKGLISSMRRINPNAQFLFATHSPELMVGIPDECVFEL